jgi:hypothetical protein
LYDLIIVCCAVDERKGQDGDVLVDKDSRGSGEKGKSGESEGCEEREVEIGSER